MVVFLEFNLFYSVPSSSNINLLFFFNQACRNYYYFLKLLIQKIYFVRICRKLQCILLNEAQFRMHAYKSAYRITRYLINESTTVITATPFSLFQAFRTMVPVDTWTRSWGPWRWGSGCVRWIGSAPWTSSTRACVSTSVATTYTPPVT